MAKTTVSITFQAEVGDHVEVQNYRCRPARWETGIVDHVEGNSFRAGKFSLSYRVRLDRETKPNWKGESNPIFVTVGDDGIAQIKIYI